MFAPLLVLAGVFAPQQQDQITVVATTDVHGRAVHWDYLHDREASWGLTRAATAIDSIRRATGDAVVLIDAGDLFQGNLFARYYATERRLALNPMVDALNVMRYDVFTPGNHDYDFGVDALHSALEYAQFNVVAANIYENNDAAYRQFVTIDRNGIRVGVTGGTTPGTAVWNQDRVAGRLVFQPILPDIGRALERMETAGVDLKVVVLHSGMGGPSSYASRGLGEENIAAQLAYLSVKPDIVVVGHSHRSMRDSVVNGVHFIQAEPWARSLAVADVTFDRAKTGRATPRFIRGHSVQLANVQPSAELTRRLDEAHRMARAWGDLPLGRADAGWGGQFSRVEDTPLIDFVNHVQLHNTGAQLSATAAFNPEAGFPSGLVKMRHIGGLYPFENRLKVVAINGATLKRYLERSAEHFNTYAPGQPTTNPAVPGYNFDMVSGIDYVLDLSMPVGSRVRQMVYEGRIVQPNDAFTLAITDYRRVAGGFDMLSNLRVVQSGDRRVIDMLVDEVRRVGTLLTESYFDPSWSIVPAAAHHAIRLAAGAPDPSVTERLVFRVIATTDIRGSVQARRTAWSAGKEVGGVTSLAAWIDSLERDCACTTIIVDAGDALGGTLVADQSFGRLMVDVMNVMGYDAAAIGERELAWGVDTLRARVRLSNFPWLAANTHLTNGGARPDWAKDWVMIERDGLRVAIVGLTGGSTGAIAMAESDRFVVEDQVDAAQRSVAQARSVGADYVIVLAHTEAYCEQTGCRGQLIDFVNGLEPGSVDLVVGGHSASEATATINDIPILLPGARGLSLGVTDVFATTQTRRVESFVQTVWVDSVSVDGTVDALVRGANVNGDVVLTTMGFPASSRADGESSLGRLVADAYRNAARSHVAIVHNGAVAGSLPAGDITYTQAYEIQPVRYQIRKLLVRGDVIKEMLEHVVLGANPIAHIAGLRVEYDPNARSGDRVKRIRLDGDRGLSGGDMYWLAVNDFVALGGGGFSMLNGLTSEPVGVSDFEAFTQYLLRLPKPVEAPRTDRIQARR